MCQRFALTLPPDAVRAYFDHVNTESYPPRYNIAPTQPVAIIRYDHHHRRMLELVRWGLIPGWVKDPRDFSTLVNARAETVTVKPSFKGAICHRRCLVPADGFYEWTGAPGAKQPQLVRPRGGGVMALAGIWEDWLGADGSELESMAILTVPANREMRTVHDRMPVILSPDQFEAWLDCRSGTAKDIKPLMRPAPDGTLDIIAVSPKLNNWRNDGPELQEPVHTRLL